MNILRKIFGGRYILIYVLPTALVACLLKIIFNQFSWEIINQSLIPFFSSLLTGIIFLLGIILAGVLTDYKESEKIPAEMAASLCSIWEETCIQEKYLVQSQKDNTGALLLQKKVYEFVKKIKTDFLTGKPDSIRCLNDILDSFSAEFLSMDSVGTPIPIMTRLRNEQANIRKLLFRIQTIRDTSFAPSLAKMVEAIIFLFTIFLLLLKFDHLINSAILMFFYAFLLTSILFLLNDLDNPFEYNQKAKIRSDEIDFELLFNRLEVSFKKKIDD